MTRLYELSTDYSKTLASLSTDDGVENPEAIAALESIKDSFNDKAINVAKYIKNLEAEGTAIQNAINNMALRAKRLNREVASLTDYLKWNIKSVGLLDKIKCPEFEIWIKNNPESVTIVDEALIPAAYIKEEVVFKIDKNAIKKDMKDGFEVEGVILTRTQTLMIK